MGSENKPELPEVFGPWLHVSHEPPYKPNFGVVQVLVFIGTGVNLGIGFTNVAHTVFGTSHAVRGSFAAIAIICILQVLYSVNESRRLRKIHEELKMRAKAFAPIDDETASTEPQEGPRTVH